MRVDKTFLIARVLRSALMVLLLALVWSLPVQSTVSVAAPVKGCASKGCHGELTTRKHVHPALDDGCETCHEAKAPLDSTPPTGPHSGGFVPMRDQIDLCGECHDVVVTTPAVKSPHGPAVSGSCTACHDPHGAAGEHLLELSPPKLCFECHEGLTDGRKHVHDPAGEGECLACHDPHGGPDSPSLKATQVSLCWECHDEISTNMEPGQSVHEPILEGACVGCHRPHGSDHQRLLKRGYPVGALYHPYNDESYPLCFSCHDRSLMAPTAVHPAQRFATAEKNLHAVHAGIPGKGRACLLCHQPHRSDRLHLLRDKVPFGAWSLPIGYTPVGTGGTCTSGCHGPLSYP